MRRLIVASLLAVVAGTGQLAAQGTEGATGGIAGRVGLADGSAVAEATVVLTGPPPVLRRSLTTGPDGRFHFTALADGLYAIETAHPRTSTAVAERLRLRAGELLFLRLTVERDAPSKLTIAAQPLLDVTTPNRSRSQDTPQLLLLPGDRTHDASLTRLAGVDEDRRTTIAGDPEATVAVQGLSVAETGLYVDAQNVTSSRTGVPTQRVPLELLETQQVSGPARTAASSSSTDATVAVLTRRPGEEWHGGATLLYTDDDLRAPARSSPIHEAPAATRSGELAELVDAGIWGGGPLVSDRAWLSLGLVPQWGEGGAVDRRRTPASARLALRPASGLQLRLHASLEDTVDPRVAASTAAVEAAGAIRQDHESFAAGLLVDWVASPRLALQGALHRFALRRELVVTAPSSPLEDEREDRVAARAHLTLSLPGRRFHTLDLGARWSEPRTEVGVSPTLATGTVTAEELSVHLHDALRLTDRLTLDLGLRGDRSRLRRQGSTQTLSFALADTLSPRLGLAWDVRGDGQWKTYGQVAWTSPPLRHHLALEAFAPERAAAVDPDLEPPRGFASVLGIDHLFLPTVRLGAELSLHTQLEGVTLLQVAPPGGASAGATEVIANPGSGPGAHPYGADLPAHPGLERTWTALTVSAQARFPRWSGYFSWVWSELDGTWNGIANPDDPTAPISPHTGDTCATLEGCFSADGEPASGPLALDRPHRVKLSGHLQLREGLTLSGFVRVQSGTPFARQVTVVTGEGSSSVLTRLFHPDGRGSGDRLPTEIQADLRLQYELVPARDGGRRLVLFADLHNAFDDQRVLVRWPTAYLDPVAVGRSVFFAGFDVDALAAAQGIAADPRFGEGLLFAAPRRLRLGLRWEW